MSRLESSPPLKSLFGPAFWVALTVVLFGVFWFQTGPGDAVRQQIAAAGPGGVTAYFDSPEQAMKRVGALAGAADWRRLAAYYDLTGSAVTADDLASGRYFAGAGARRPFPAGYRLVGAERVGATTYVRALYAGDFRSPGDFSSGRTVTVYFIRSPEGYRLVPDDAEALRAALAGAP